jgi:hypothetical protein
MDLLLDTLSLPKAGAPELAEWDAEGLAGILGALEKEGANVAALGWSEEEMEAMLKAPDFDPDEGDQPDLGTLKPYRCPHCDGEFTLKELKEGQHGQ